MTVPGRSANLRKRLTPTPVDDEIEEKMAKRQNHPNSINYSDDRQESAENESQDQEELEVNALCASKKYSNMSPVYHIFKKT
jgi:hypothetical protein